MSKENYSETKAVLVFEDKTKSDFFDLEGNAKRNSNTPLTLCALLPLSTWQNAGAYTVTVMYSAYGRDYKKFSLPISIEKKDFVSETIELDSKNTDIKTDVSPARMNQIERLNDILFTVDSASVYLNSAFVPPTTATRRTSFFGDRRVYAYTGGGQDVIYVDNIRIDKDPASGISGVTESSKTVKSVKWYSLDGREMSKPGRGVSIKTVTYTAGTSHSSKIVSR